MSLAAHLAYQNHIFEQLHFIPEPLPFGTRWADPRQKQNGFCTLYRRANDYCLAIADYTIPRPFALAFNSTASVLRFGSFYEGRTHFHVEGIANHSSSPVHFIVKEQGISGCQYWHTGNHYRGIELALSQEYLHAQEALEPTIAELAHFPTNITQNILPPQVVTVLKETVALSSAQLLTPLRLESIVLQCLSCLVEANSNNFFSSSEHQLTAHIGKRKLTFSESDLQAVYHARKLIAEHPEDDHTIASLSREVFLNEQKLKIGFSRCFHTTIGAYLKECRMARASELLLQTSLSISEIARACGYASSTGFIKAFRQKYTLTPLHFRTQKATSTASNTSS